MRLFIKQNQINIFFVITLLIAIMGETIGARFCTRAG